MRVGREPAWDYAYQRKLDEQVENLKDHLGAAGAVDWGSYQYICGQIRGIQVAIDELTRIRQQFNLDEDQDLRGES